MRARVLTLTLAGALGAVVAASALAAPKAKIAPPQSISKAGKIVYCSDVSYPPEES